ncbi:MAG: MotA/TolQ/ExbB proton channel family protein [Oceanococcaceae bacterium]
MEVFTAIRDFLETGGSVLWLILVVAVLLWALIIERLMFYRREFPGIAAGIIERWRARGEYASWQARRQREALVSEANRTLKQSIGLIKTIIALCPLLGLLGTVTGMVQVFDVMAVLGTGNARAMAAGVSKATLPTMAGMVVALSGLYFSSHFEQVVRRETDYLNDELGVHSHEN